MAIQKPEPLVIGNKAFYTLTSYGPVDVEVHVVRTTDEEVELAIQTLVREAGGTEKDLADPAWVASHFDGIENEQRLREQTRAYLSSLSEDSAECIQSSKSRQFALSISHTSLGACPNP